MDHDYIVRTKHLASSADRNTLIFTKLLFIYRYDDYYFFHNAKIRKNDVTGKDICMKGAFACIKQRPITLLST